LKKLTGVAKTVAVFGVFTALCFVCGYIEFLLPLPFLVPGMKLGLANLVVLSALYTLGARTAAGVSLVRIVLSALTFGSLYGMLYSLAGAVLSFLVMLCLYRLPCFGTVGVSVAGGICHNIGQLLVAFAFLGVGGVLTYAPVLLLSGAVTGFLIGIAVQPVLPRIKKLL
jgi:heptaprenyl diphosphate synthase